MPDPVCPAPLRLRRLNAGQVRASARYVLYWMTAYRRTSWNFGLDRACAWCRQLGKPLLVFEPLRCDYRWASDRLHRFIVDGMEDNDRALARHRVTYYPYLEPEPGAGKGLLRALARDACVVVADDYPGFFYPAMLAAGAQQVTVSLEALDGNGLLPLGAADKTFARAYDFRRHLQRTLLPHLAVRPRADSLADSAELGRAKVADQVMQRWPPAALGVGGRAHVELSDLPIDHRVAPVSRRGGEQAARETLQQFLDCGLERYAEARNHPDLEATSNLSAYLHFGHLSVHEVFHAVATREQWAEDQVAAGARGQREGWWGLDPGPEAFLDQLITWRELGLNRAAREADSTSLASLPPWVRATLDKHAGDPRPYRYRRDQFAAAATHDPLWNAAQRQLLTTGTIHNYLRMLWGKKILHWSDSPEEALETLFELNDRYALDGRGPNSVSGITWCLGRYDRAWGPERPIFGTVRYMSSRNTARKVHLRQYLQRYASEDA